MAQGIPQIQRWERPQSLPQRPQEGALSEPLAPELAGAISRVADVWKNMDPEQRQPEQIARPKKTEAGPTGDLFTDLAALEEMFG